VRFAGFAGSPGSGLEKYSSRFAAQRGIALDTIAPTTSRVGHWPLPRSIIRYRARNQRSHL